jgi:hypothetical protein
VEFVGFIVWIVFGTLWDLIDSAIILRRKEGRKEGRKEERKEGREEGRKEGREYCVCSESSAIF